LTDEKDIKPLLKHREKFAHKGNFGHALLVAGSQGMAGASVLAARAALRSGVGLLTVHLPHCNNIVVQAAVPEAMTSIDSCITHFSDELDTSRYSVVAVGPGLGQNEESEKALLHLIDNCEVPMVIDADALNILSRNPQYLQRLPQGSVITPHVGEFNRLFGKTNNSYIRLMASLAYAKSFGVTIVLKGAHTVVTSPTGIHYFNTTGNPGMATAGSGDVLTGIIAALLAQGYTAPNAARLGVYLHGLAGDLAASVVGEVALIASDIVEYIPVAWNKIYNDK
jgi:NAD(P)H-hydrate epimerase